MFKYILKRLLLAIPTLLILSIVIFLLSRAIPGDPLSDIKSLSNNSGFNERLQSEYCKQYFERNLNLPLFYFGISPKSLDPAISQNCLYSEREWLRTRALETGSYETTSAMFDAYKFLQLELYQQKDSIDRDLYINANNQLTDFTNRFASFDPSELQALISRDSVLNMDAGLNQALNDFIDSRMAYHQEGDGTINNWIPVLRWNGTQNQYHVWIKRILSMDFGLSVLDKNPAGAKINAAMKWTLMLVLTTYFLSFLLSIPLGVYLAKYQDSKRERIISMTLYLLYAIPVFWLASIMVVFFTTSEYGKWTDIFPTVLPISFSRTDPFFVKFFGSLKYMILPILILMVHAMSSIVRMVQTNVHDTLNMEYIRTAYAKGLSKSKVLWRHSFKNASLPLVTLFFGTLPAGFIGSLVIEIIFNIPGMGRLMFDSIFAQDWNVVFAAVFMFGVITIICYLFMDLCYFLLNPKIKLDD